MRNNFNLIVLLIIVISVGLMHSCRKETVGYPGPQQQQQTTPIILGDTITESYTEEFQNVYALTQMGWQIGEYSEKDDGGYTNWGQGFVGLGPGAKTDSTNYGFAAYSYTYSNSEYLYSYSPALDSNLSLSSWLLTPSLYVKNGDKISFYTRGDTTGSYTDRMQVLLDTLGSIFIGHSLYSVGDYTTVMFDINASQSAGGYPTNWTKYEYTFTNLSEKKVIRIGFRHYVSNPKNARGIGLDLFKFEVK